MIVGQFRGSFPHGPAGEAAQAKRLRYEAWLIGAHADIIAAQGQDDALEAEGDDADGQKRHLDPLYRAAVAHPRHSAVSRASKKAAIAARCWECLGCDDDFHAPAGKERIKACASVACELHSVRPYQPEGTIVPLVPMTQVAVNALRADDHRAKAMANPGSRALAIKGYCHSCCGGVREVNTMRLVRDCAAATCALFEVRPGLAGLESSVLLNPPTANLPQGVQKGFENLADPLGVPKATPESVDAL